MKSGLANISLSEVLESPSQWLGSMFWALRRVCFFFKREQQGLCTETANYTVCSKMSQLFILMKRIST